MTTTLVDDAPLERIRRAQTLRRIGASALVLFVLAGAVGAFGTRIATKTTESGGYRMELSYPGASRPGHAVRFELRIHHSGGFTDPIRVRMASRYFDLFDENSFDPDADSQTTDATYQYLEYKAPKGEDFVITSDTRIEPDRQRGEAGEVSVLDGNDSPVASLRFHTRIWP